MNAAQLAAADSPKAGEEVSGALTGVCEMTPPDLWTTNPWLTSHRIGAAHGQGIDADQQERGHAMYAALSERSAATIAAAGHSQKTESDETQRPEAALSDWEDEGGSTAGRASPENVKFASG
jgi:hypothetical protein